MRACERNCPSALAAVCQSLAEQIVTDGEGVQHVIRLVGRTGRSREEALLVARTIAHSMLVKTAWAGADPNWGRILAAVGRCGVPIDPSRVQIFIGRQKVCRNGAATTFNEKKAHAKSSATEMRYSCATGARPARGAISHHRSHRRVCADQRRLFHIEKVSGVWSLVSGNHDGRLKFLRPAS
jgi:N-acetylglutamate synthase/N-acetylornithine aminotransferase